MDIMRHGHDFFRPAGTRTPGGADYPVAVDETFPPLPPPLPPETGVTVGVIDTGLVLDGAHNPHPWFGDHVFFREEDEDPLGQGRGDADEHGYLADADGHGTFVAGLILREAPTARVTMCGVLDKSENLAGDTLGADDDQRVAEAVRSLALDTHVQVINLSFAGGVFANAPTNLENALLKLHDRVAVVAAAGNGASDEPVWPAAFATVISVGALDERRLIPPGATPPRAAFSNYGDWVKAYADGVQVLGPFVYFDETGGDVHGLRPPQHFRGWARWSGTSFAAATVSGRIAQTAIERGITGAQAAQVVLGESRKISIYEPVWVRGAD
jgi:subtilisin family serine protease